MLRAIFFGQGNQTIVYVEKITFNIEEQKNVVNWSFWNWLSILAFNVIDKGNTVGVHKDLISTYALQLSSIT